MDVIGLLCLAVPVVLFAALLGLRAGMRERKETPTRARWPR